MATTASTWLMTEANADGSMRGFGSRAIISDPPYGIVSGTEQRDVSDMLDSLALAETPFINKIGWGADSGGVCIEWISEDLGPGMIKTLSTIASDWVSFVVGSIDGLDASDAIAQIKQGSILYMFSSTSAEHSFAVVTSTGYGKGGVSVFVSIIGGPGWISIVAQDTFYVLGAVANEGSVPNEPTPRQRALASNCFMILREDVQITGSMKSTDMYVIGKEDKHQMLMRLKELQRARERFALYGLYSARTSAAAAMINGVYGFLSVQSGSNIDNSTYVLTETAINNMVEYLWENGSRNLTFFGHISQTGKFTNWDKSRIRMEPRDTRGGGYITKYMTNSGVEIDLEPMGRVPKNFAFILDTSKIKLRAKKGRKLLIEKLGKMGDFDDWQMLSEFSMEMRGYNLHQHGMFTKLV